MEYQKIINLLDDTTNQPSILRTRHRKYYLPTVEIKYYNVMINGRKYFDQPTKNDLKHK